MIPNPIIEIQNLEIVRIAPHVLGSIELFSGVRLQERRSTDQ